MSDDLVKRLTIKAGVMEMGEKIAWGSDTSLMREAADRIEELEEENARLRKDVSGAAAIILSGGINKIAPVVLNTVYSESIKWESYPAMIRGDVPQETVTLAIFQECLRAIATLAELKGETDE